jgi:hypothetical protein
MIVIVAGYEKMEKGSECTVSRSTAIHSIEPA